jgi:hypothetical protein
MNDMKKNKYLYRLLMKSESLRGVDCLGDELMCAYADKRLFGNELERVKKHLASCHSCRMSLLELITNNKVIEGFSLEKPHEEKKTKQKEWIGVPRWGLVAATIFLITGISLILTGVPGSLFNNQLKKTADYSSLADHSLLRFDLPNSAKQEEILAKPVLSPQEQRWNLYKDQFIRKHNSVTPETKLSNSAKAGFNLGFYQPFTVELTADGSKQAPFYLTHITSKWQHALESLQKSAPSARNYKDRLERINASKSKDHIQLLRELIDLDKEINTWMLKSRPSDLLSGYRLGQWSFNMWENGPNALAKPRYISEVQELKKQYPKHQYPHIYSCLDRIEGILKDARGEWNNKVYRDLIKELALLVGVFQEPQNN